MKPIGGLQSYKPDDPAWTMHGSFESAILVEDERESKYIQWEYDYIGRELAHFHRVSQDLLAEGGEKFVDRIVVKRANGEIHAFFFDITVPYLAGIVKMKTEYDKMVAAGKIKPDSKLDKET